MQNLQQFDIEGFQIEELQAFVAVVQTMSFAAAAKALQKDASVISKRIKSLEQRLQTPLFVRTTRRVGVTEAGELYYHRIETILGELLSAGREITDLAARPQGLLRISLPNTFGRRRISTLLPQFMKMYPDLRIDARFTDRFVDVVAEGYDVTIRLGKMSDSSLTARKVASYRNVLAASPNYLNERGRPQHPDDLKAHACLGFVSHASWPDWPLRKGGLSETVRPTGPLVTDNSELVLEAALQDAGIILAPDWLIGMHLDSGTLEEILPGWAGPSDFGVYIVLPPGRMIPAKTRAFIDYVSDAFASYRKLDGGVER
ncbi:LysR family transcriptional regulator [Agrobacterium sp. NPDC090273]|uniref:LysR family transcriptional regulator n=1 Tax=Agrobacterium sp. NPDC090273 TaxID=3363919 RepID=UPI00383A2222